MHEPTNPKTLEAEIARLPDLGLDELRARWKTVYGRPAPRFFRRKLLIRAIAHQMQVRAYGGLSEATKRRLREIAAAVRDGTVDAAMAAPRIKPGTRLIRTYKDTTHSILVLDEGFEWQSRRYDSLSAIAKGITGTNWNGWAFFGLKRPATTDAHDIRGKFRRPGPGPDGKVSWPRSRKAKARTRGEIASA